MSKNLQSFIRARVLLTLFLLVGIVIGPLAFLSPRVEISSNGLIAVTVQSPVLATGEDWLDGWAYRKCKDITDNDNVTDYQLVGLNLHNYAGEDTTNDFYFGAPDFGEETGSWSVGGIAYTTRLEFTIDYTKIDSTLTNFPVLVKLTSKNFPFALANSDGFDFKFTENDGSTLLKYERERHDSTGTKAEYWVKIPSVSSSIDTTFYLYFRTTDTADGEDATNVWDNYTAVYHLNDVDVSTPPPLAKQISQSTDDGLVQDGALIINGLVIAVGENPFPFTYEGNGMRFTDITIPQGSIVFSAILQLYGKVETATITESEIRLQDDDDTITFSDIADYNARSQTATSIEWDIDSEDWSIINWNDSPQLGELVTSVIAKPGWDSGNSLVVFWNNNNADAADYKLAWSWDGDVDRAPRLILEYITGGKIFDSKSGSIQCNFNTMDSTTGGQIGLGLDNDSTEFASFLDKYDPESDSFCVEAYVNFHSTTTAVTFAMSKGNENSIAEGWSIWLNGIDSPFVTTPTLYVRMAAADGTSQRAAQSIQNYTTGFHYVALVIDRTADIFRGYLDGSNAGWVSIWGADDISSYDSIDIATSFILGRGPTLYNLDGAIDEVRITKGTVRSAAWIKASYHSGSDDLLSTSIGGESEQRVKDYFDDLRVTASDGVTLIPYALRDVTAATAELCIKIDVSANKIIYLYYGNPSANRASESEEVFIFSQFMQESTFITSQIAASHALCTLSDGTILFISQTPSSGMLKWTSSDGGRTWGTHTSLDVEGAQPMLTAIDIGGIEHLILTYWIGPFCGEGFRSEILVSVDGGESWGGDAYGTPPYSDLTPIVITPVGIEGDITSGRAIHSRVISYVENGVQKLGVVTSNACGHGTWWNEPPRYGRIYWNYCLASNLMTWIEILATSEGDSAEEGYVFAEPVVLEVKNDGEYNGDFYILIRCEDKDTPELRCIYSTDYGQHWGNNAPDYDNMLTDSSGLTQIEPDAIDMIRSSEGDLIVAYDLRADIDDGEIRLIKPTGEDMGNSSVEVTFTESENYANVWRSRSTGGHQWYGYPVVTEIPNSGQFGVIFWNPTGAIAKFFYIEKGAFKGQSFSYSNTTKLTWSHEEQAMQMEEALVNSEESVLSYNPAYYDYILETSFKTINHASIDQNSIKILDGTNMCTIICFPYKDDNTAVQYWYNPWPTSAELYGSFIEEVKYKSRWTYYEGPQLFDLELFSDTWGDLSASVTDQLSIHACPDIDRWKIGSISATTRADIYWYWITLRQYTASPPVWGNTGEEESLSISNEPDSYNFGILLLNDNSYTTIDYFTINNTGSLAVDIEIHATDLIGGLNVWTLSDTTVLGENIYGLKAGLDDGDDLFDIVVKRNEAYNEIVNNLGLGVTQDWGLQLFMPPSTTGYSGRQMSATLTLVCSAH